MRPDPEFDGFIEALRADLPTEQDCQRLRTRLSALGVAVATGASTSGAAAAVSVGQSAAMAGAGGTAAQATAWTAAVKIFAIAAISGSAAAGPVWYLHASVPKDSTAPISRPSVTTVVPPSSRPPAAPPNEATRPAASAMRPTPFLLPLPLPQAPAQATPPEATAEPPSRQAIAEPPSRQAMAAEATSRSTFDLRAGSASGGVPNSRMHGASQVDLPGDEPNRSIGMPRAVAPSPDSLTARAKESETKPSSTLAAETHLIDEALSALRDGDTVRARARIAEHERRFPRGLLERERERAQQRLETLVVQKPTL